MLHVGPVKVLLIDDDEDDFILTRDLFLEMPGQQFAVEWARTYEDGLDKLLLNQHDVCLVDYRLGAGNGVELLRTALERGCQAPIIVLTGAGEHLIDVEAMQAGASDYLVKSQLRADSLERSIRYALQRKRAAAQAAFEQARLAAFGAEIGLALVRPDSLDTLLSRCAKIMAQYLNAGLTELAVFNPEKNVFETRALAGPLAARLPASGRSPAVRLDWPALAAGQPLLLKQLAGDARVGEQDWLAREGLAAYAAYPLRLEDKLVGLMALFAQQPLSEQILQEMGSVANGIALGIERKRSEEALDRSEVKYRTVVDTIKEVIFQLDEFGHWTFLNPAWTAVTGFDVQPTLGTFFLEYLCPEDQEPNRQIFLKLIRQEIDFCRHETRFYTKAGKVRWVEMYAQATVDRNGAVLGASGTLTDITERKAAEAQIQKLAAFPQLNPNPVLEFAPDGRLTYANEAAHELASSLRRSDLLSILPPGPDEIVRQCLTTGQRKLRQEVMVDGHILTWSFFPIAAGQVVHCYGADATEMLNLEAQLRHAQKLESVGQLAAGVAHDFNNILTVIQGYSECLLARAPQDPATANALKQISLSAQRAAGLTRQLLLFSRKQVMQPKLLDLSAVVHNLATMLGRLVGENIVLEHDYAPELPAIEADTNMLEQIVMNLAVNARDAMSNGGRLHLATALVPIDAAYVQQHPEARTGSFVCLTVTDTGCGMDRKTLERIFEPFFTTKEVGKGSGLGLATVYGIVKQHKGWIEVASEPGHGTTFRIYFPACNGAALSPATTQVLQDLVRGGKETIFLVEDDPTLREFVREVLGEYQYHVIEAATGVEALRVWDEHNGQVDLLLTDMVMPDGMSGRDLALQLRKRRPDLKIIVSSGYSAEMSSRDFALEGAWFLPKPYNPAQLAQLVRQCLDTSPVSINPAVPSAARRRN